jgi:formiminotetrahydrofolate cyclodeaminase
MNYGDQTLDEFLSGIASKRVTPAGGTATAVVGAMGATLCEMVCIHTLGNDEVGVRAADLTGVRDELRRERAHLLGLAEADARVVDDLFPTSGDEFDQSTLKQSIGVPLAIAEACLNVLRLATEVTEKGTGNAVADAGTGVVLAHSALRAAVFTARSNVERVSDPSFVAEIERRTTEIEAAADDAYDRAMEHVEARA